MNKSLLCVLALLINFAIMAQPAIRIIPQPNEMQARPGKFVFSSCTRLQYDPVWRTAVEPLITKLKNAAAIDLLSKKACAKKSIIVVSIDKTIADEEGYRLIIQPQKILLQAGTAAGIFYGVQSLLQLLPGAVEKDSVQKNVEWSVPCAEIHDQPRFAYRGIMLDVARHYMPIDFIKKLVDLMAMQKMNRLHLHLTDSQGWRFESKKYPKLTQIGAYRKGTPLNATYDYNSRPGDSLYGGYYTQQQLRDLVQYAAARFITIVPEIEMPAHSMSALASYPELACVDSAGKAFAYPQQIQNEYCTKDETFTFLDNVLEEVMDVFPGKYIHVAGDEASKANWKTCPYCRRRMKEEGLKNVEELQSYFIRRIEKFVNSKGRNIIGWDEILQGGLAPNASVMSWTGIDGGIKAAQQHHQAVMTPEDYCYFDHYQSDAPGEPVAFGGLTTLSTVYGYEPVPAALNTDEAKYIQGTQGNLWTEYVPMPAKAEYMIFPRALALAEVAWTQPAKKNFEDFTGRLSAYLGRLDTYHVNYSKHMFDIKLNTSLNNNEVTAIISGVTKDHAVHYTLDGSIPGEGSPVYTHPVIIQKNSTVIAAILRDGIVSDQVKKSFSLHKAVGKPVVLQIPPDKRYSKGGSNAWVNGSLGNDEHFSDDEWLGWDGESFDGTIDFGSEDSTSSLQTRFFQKPSSWVWVAKKVTVQTSADGKTFTTVAEKEVSPPSTDGAMPFTMSWAPVTARYLRIIAEPLGIIPAGNTGAGDRAWLFVDEMIVN